MKKETVDTLLACCFANPSLTLGLTAMLYSDRSKSSMVHRGAMAVGYWTMTRGLASDLNEMYPGFSAVIAEGRQLTGHDPKKVLQTFRNALIELGALNADWPPEEQPPPQPTAAPASVPEGVAA